MQAIHAIIVRDSGNGVAKFSDDLLAVIRVHCEMPSVTLVLRIAVSGIQIANSTCTGPGRILLSVITFDSQVSLRVPWGLASRAHPTSDHPCFLPLNTGEKRARAFPM